MLMSVGVTHYFFYRRIQKSIPWAGQRSRMKSITSFVERCRRGLFYNVYLFFLILHFPHLPSVFPIFFFSLSSTLLFSSSSFPLLFFLFLFISYLFTSFSLSSCSPTPPLFSSSSYLLSSLFRMKHKEFAVQYSRIRSLKLHTSELLVLHIIIYYIIHTYKYTYTV